jgi:hypothetical protein
MGYCRYRNTLRDLRDCYEAMRRPDEEEDRVGGLSAEECNARRALLRLCGAIAEWDSQGEVVEGEE